MCASAQAICQPSNTDNAQHEFTSVPHIFSYFGAARSYSMVSSAPYVLRWGIMATGHIAESKSHDAAALSVHEYNID